MIYKTIDLCAGIGGIRRGFELTGKFENVLSAEIDEYACKTYEHLFGENPKNDLTSEEFKELVSRTEYDILLAGFPCQTFSRVGSTNGISRTTKEPFFLISPTSFPEPIPAQSFWKMLKILYLIIREKHLGVL